MSTLWARIEPLLARVQKPARYIGCEDGAITPRHDDRRGQRWRGCSPIPTPTRSVCPTRGSRSSTKSSTSGTMRVAERTYAPWTDLDREMRAAGVPLFSVDTHRAAADFDMLAFNLSSRAGVHQRAQHDRSRRVPRARRRSFRRRPARDRRRPRRVQPRAARPTSSTPPCSARARRSSSEITEVVRAWKARRAHRPRSVSSATLDRSPACTCRRCTTSPTTATASSSVDPALSRRTGHGRQAHRRRSRRVALSRSSRWCRSPRSCTTA